jgi:Protein of unknown function (DUF3024)
MPAREGNRKATVALAEIELARIRKAMDAFMQQRRPPVHVRAQVDLAFRVTGQSVEIFEIRPVWRGPPDEMQELPVAKATYVKGRGVWRVFWQRRDLKWHSYKPKPEVKSVEEFASLVSEDAHTCFFG